MPSGDIYQATFKYLSNGSTYMNVVHFYNDGFVGNLQDVGVALINSWGAAIRELQTGSTALYAVRVHQRHPIGPAPVEVAISNFAGLRNSEPPIGQCAFLLRLKTSLFGRSRMGRVYIPGVMAAMLQNGVWGGQNFGYAGTARTTLILKHMDTQAGMYTKLRLGVFSRKISEFTSVTQIEWDIIPAIRRSRRIGVGI